MMTSIDSNIVVALWWKLSPFNAVAAQMLAQAQQGGALILSAPVYAELMGDPARTESGLDDFLSNTGISVDWVLEEEVWREAGRAHRGYIQRRKVNRDAHPRRILADFLIGAQALIRGYALLTFDLRLYAAAFPNLKIVSE
ncbi:MAG: type II toxin-antitoxin system VapC family toxin [Terracidiphilus sp.]